MLCHVSKFITHKQTTNYMLKILGKGVFEVEGEENDDD